ncbi:hypothetical protein BC826DRAFT_1001317 [Russula brevipes]|nr:hypothetical protein BC826DRAFT_1001317 [Russula brevipes]
MASRIMPHLKRKESVPDIVWRTLDKLSKAPDLPDADDDQTLTEFGDVRDITYKMIIEEEEHQSNDQFKLLGLLNTIAARLRFPELPTLDL